MSCVKTFAYDLSVYLANILSPGTCNSELTVTNSATSVESLFTNVPIDAAVQAALQKLEKDLGLANRKTLTPYFRIEIHILTV